MRRTGRGLRDDSITGKRFNPSSFHPEKMIIVIIKG